MNFKNMPELNWNLGYFAILTLMLFIATALVLYFRRQRWL